MIIYNFNIPRITGVMVQYYTACKRELWFFAHKIHFEEDENVLLGKLIHEEFYQQQKKNILIDDVIAPDFIMKGKKSLIFEIKKSSKLTVPTKNQVLYYLWYLKHHKGLLLDATVVYPKERKQEKITLSPKEEEKIKKIIQKIKEIISLPQPPSPEKKKYCRKCAYFEFCWIE